MYKESHLRSALKTISWRFWATVTTMALVYLFTGALTIAMAIGGIEVILKIIIYFLHERTWDKIRFGRKEISPFVLWFTGLPASGKTTLADSVAKKLSQVGFKVERLDGDNVRNIFPKTGFSKEERNIHIKRVGFLASILEKNGTIVVASFASPYKEARDFVRNLCGNFVEIFVATPIEVCEKRDMKGLYEKARKGEIKNLTGVNDPYEVPDSPDLIVNTENKSAKDASDIVIKHLNQKNLLS